MKCFIRYETFLKRSLNFFRKWKQPPWPEQQKVIISPWHGLTFFCCCWRKYIFFRPHVRLKCTNGHFLQCRSVQQELQDARGKQQEAKQNKTKTKRLSAVDPSARLKRRHTRLSKCCCRGWSWFAGWPTCIWGGSVWCTWRPERRLGC